MAEKGAWHLVGTKVPDNGRLHARLEGRQVSVMLAHGKLYAMDSLCFHGGGPLTMGAIEEIDGKTCVNCPWHNYKITVETGEKLYQHADFDKVTKKLTPKGWKSVGQRQRVHEVEQREDGIYIRIDPNVGANEVESDKYAAHKIEECSGLLAPDSKRSSAGTPRAPGAPNTSGGAAGGQLPGTTGSRGYAGKPSGQIFQEMKNADK